MVLVVGNGSPYFCTYMLFVELRTVMVMKRILNLKCAKNCDVFFVLVGFTTYRLWSSSDGRHGAQR